MALAGPEITPRRRALLVALRHGLPEIGVAPVSFRKIQSILGVPKSTCSDIYKHALKNATATAHRQLTNDDSDQQEAASLSAESADVFLAGIEAQLDKIYTEPRPKECLDLEEKDSEAGLPLLELISADCLDSDARCGRPQSLSGAERDHLIATAKRDWGTRHMSLIEIQREAGLGHVHYATIIRALYSQGIKAYVEECMFILNEDNKKRRMVSGPQYSNY